MLVVEFLFLVLPSLLLWSGCCDADAKKLCRDPECRDPISLARAVRAHRSADGRLLSFDATDTITVYAKHQEPNQEIWEGAVNSNDQLGYFPRGMVEEITVFEPSPQYTVAIGPGHTNRKVTSQSANEHEDIKKDETDVEGEHLQTQTADSSRLHNEELVDVPDPVIQWRQKQSQQEESREYVMEDGGKETATQSVDSEDMKVAPLDPQEDDVTGQSVEDHTKKKAHEQEEELGIYEQLKLARRRVQTLQEKTDDKVQLLKVAEGTNIEEELAAARKRVDDLLQHVQEEEEQTAFNDDESADPEVGLNERDEMDIEDEKYEEQKEKESNGDDDYWDDEADEYREEQYYKEEEDTLTTAKTDMYEDGVDEHREETKTDMYENGVDEHREETKTEREIEYGEREELRDVRYEMDAEGTDNFVDTNEDDKIDEVSDNLEASNKEIGREDNEYSMQFNDQADLATKEHDEGTEHNLTAPGQETHRESLDDKTDGDRPQRQELETSHDDELNEIDKRRTTEDIESAMTNVIRNTNTETLAHDRTPEEANQHLEQDKTVTDNDLANKMTAEQQHTDEPSSSEADRLSAEKETESEDSMIMERQTEELMKDKRLVMEEYTTMRQDTQSTDEMIQDVEKAQVDDIVSNQQETDEILTKEVTGDKDVDQATDGQIDRNEETMEYTRIEETGRKTGLEQRKSDEAQSEEDIVKDESVAEETMQMDQTDAMGVESGADVTNRDEGEPISHEDTQTDKHEERDDVHTDRNTEGLINRQEVGGDSKVSQEVNSVVGQVEHTETVEVDDHFASKLNDVAGQAADSDIETDDSYKLTVIPVDEQVKETETLTASFTSDAEVQTTNDKEVLVDTKNEMPDDTANPSSLTQTDMMLNESTPDDKFMADADHFADFKRENLESTQQYRDVKHEEQTEQESPLEHGQQQAELHQQQEQPEINASQSDAISDANQEQSTDHPKDDQIDDQDEIQQMVESIPRYKEETSSLQENEKVQNQMTNLSVGDEVFGDTEYGGEKGSSSETQGTEEDLVSESDDQLASGGDELSDEDLVRIREEENRRHKEEKQKIKEANQIPEYTEMKEKTAGDDQAEKKEKDKVDENTETDNSKDEENVQTGQSDVAESVDVNTDDRQAGQQINQNVQDSSNVSLSEQGDKPDLISSESETMDEFDEEFREREARYMKQLDKVEDQREQRYLNQLQEDKEDAMKKTRAHLESAYSRRFDEVKRKGAGNNGWVETELQRLEKEKEEGFIRDERLRDEDIAKEMNSLREQRKERRQEQLERFQAIEKERVRIRREEKNQRDLEYQKELEKIEKERQQRILYRNEEERLRREAELREEEERAKEKEAREREEREVKERQRLEEIARQWDRRMKEKKDAASGKASATSSTQNEEMGNQDKKVDEDTVQEDPLDLPNVADNSSEGIPPQDDVLVRDNSDQREMETKDSMTVNETATAESQDKQMSDEGRDDGNAEPVENILHHHDTSDLPETQNDDKDNITDMQDEDTTSKTFVLEANADVGDDDSMMNKDDGSVSFSDWSSSRKPKNLDREDGDEPKEVESEVHEDLDSLNEQDYTHQAKGFLPELVSMWFDGASSLVIFGTAIAGILPIFLLFCFCGGSKGPNVEVMKKKFEEQLVAAITERDNAQTESTASKKKTELLERNLREERESNALLQEEKNRSQQAQSRLLGQQQKLEEEVRQLSNITSQQALDLQTEQAHSAYYQQQLAASVEQTTTLQHQLQQLQSDIETYTTSEDQLKSEVEQMKGQIAQLEQAQNRLSQENNQWQQQCQSYEDQLAAAHKETAKVQMSLTETEKEADILRDCLQQLNAIALADRDEDPTEDEETRKQKMEELQRQKFNDLVNTRKASSELKASQQECKELQARLHVERDAHQQLQKKLDKLQSDYDVQREMYTTTESQFTQTNAKLQALSEYLKEREETLQMKLGKEEAAKALIANREQTASERAAAAEEDMARQRQQVNELRQQMAEIEKNLLQQLSTNEKRAQEALAQLHSCEQQLRKSNEDVTTLRRRLTDAENHIALSQRPHPPGPAFGPMPPLSQHSFNRPISPHGPPGPPRQMTPPEKRHSMPSGQRSPPGQRRDSRDNPPRSSSRPPSRGPIYPPRPNSIGPTQESMLPRRDSKGLPHPDAMAPHRPEVLRPPRPDSVGALHAHPGPLGPSPAMPFHSLPPMSHRMPPPGRGGPMPGPRTSSPSGKYFDVPDGPVRYQQQPLQPGAFGGLPPRPGLVPVRQPIPRQPMMHPFQPHPGGHPLEQQHRMDGHHPGNSNMHNEI